MFMRKAIIGTILVVLSLMSGMWTGEKVFGKEVPIIQLNDAAVVVITGQWASQLSRNHGVVWLVNKITYTTKQEATVDVTTLFTNRSNRRVESESRYLLLVSRGKVVGATQIEKDDSSAGCGTPKSHKKEV